MEIIGHIFLGLLLGEGLVGAAMIFCTARFCLRLEKHHHELWGSLGRPRFGGNRNLNHTKYLRFLRLRQYASLRDDTTRRLAQYTRAANKVFLTYTFVASGAVFAVIFLHNYVL